MIDTIDLIERDAKWARVAEQAFKAKRQRVMYEALEQRLFNELKALSENQSSYAGRWAYVASYRVGIVDYASIPQLMGIDLDAYRKEPITVWQLQPRAE
jgi:hypothetical protein